MAEQTLSPLTPALIDPRSRPLLPVGKQAAMALELVGLPAVLEMVLAGHAQTAIAARLGISQAGAGWPICGALMQRSIARRCVRAQNQ
jgi:hypothetical protein